MSRDKERVEWRVLQMAAMVDGGPPDWPMLQNQGVSITDARNMVKASSKRGHVFADIERPPGTKGEKIMRVRLNRPRPYSS